jgi:hypothetical protein
MQKQLVLKVKEGEKLILIVLRKKNKVWFIWDIGDGPEPDSDLGLDVDWA